MNYSIYNENEWVFPDTEPTNTVTATLHLAKGAHCGFYILGESGVEKASVKATLLSEKVKGISVTVHELLSVGVDENTAATLMTTTDYNSCKDFVTRKAPFRVYDAIRPLNNEPLREDRLALFVQVHALQAASAGEYQLKLEISVNGITFEVAFCCVVHKASVPSVKKARLGMMNFCYFENIATQHNIKLNSNKYWQVYRKYINALLRLRSTHITLPQGVPVKDENEKIIGFDFTAAEKMGKIALEQGMPYLCGSNFAHWHNWNEKDYYLAWDNSVSTLSVEGYLQLKMYFEAWAKVIKRNKWQKIMTQSLADEPQVHNDITYRALAAVCRKFLPGIKIIEAVETVDLGGGIDIWVPKQDTFEKHRKAYEQLKAAGEEMWFYTCAFPAGEIMNRSMDIPLLASRSVLWVGYSYGLTGFLHWGLNFYIGEDIWNKACCPHKGALLPAGDAHIVYPDGENVLISARLHVQAAGAEDYELLRQLSAFNKPCADEIAKKACTNFRTYEKSGKAFDEVKKELLEQLDKYIK